MTEAVRFLLRVPHDLWEDVKQWAVEEDRSIDAQIAHVLRRAVREWRPRP